VGLGLNVNQTNFENLPKASSLAVVCERTFDKDEILSSIVKNIQLNIQMWELQADEMREKYIANLFKIGVPMPFQNSLNQNFMGIIQGISAIGKLQILLEDDSIAEFDIKEIQMLY